MTAKELNRIFQKGECLSLDTMRLYIDGKLSKKSMHEVEKHLIECGLCSAAMDGLTPRRMQEVNKLSAHIEKRLAVYMNTPPAVPFFRRFGFALITGALLLGGGTCWFFAQNKGAVQPGNDSASAAGSSTQAFIQPPATVQASATSDRPLDNGAVVVHEEPAGTESSGSQAPASTKKQELSASLPGQPTTLTVNQEPAAPTITQVSNPVHEEQPSGGPGTRVASTTQALHIKTIIVYPAVTHSDRKETRKESKGGQIDRSGPSDASFKLDEMPSFPGGNEALRNYILQNFRPVNLDRSKISRFSTGVLFVVNAKTGTVTAPELSFSISPEVDAELLRVISSMPDWNPGKKRGEVDVMLGITFSFE